MKEKEKKKKDLNLFEGIPTNRCLLRGSPQPSTYPQEPRRPLLSSQPNHLLRTTPSSTHHSTRQRTNLNILPKSPPIPSLNLPTVPPPDLIPHLLPFNHSFFLLPTLVESQSIHPSHFTLPQIFFPAISHTSKTPTYTPCHLFPPSYIILPHSPVSS